MNSILTFVQGKLLTFTDQIKACTSFKLDIEIYALLLKANFIENKSFYTQRYDNICDQPLVAVSFYHVKPFIVLEVNEEKKEITFIHTRTGDKQNYSISEFVNNTIVIK